MIDHLVARQQRIEMVSQGLEARGVAFSNHLLTNRFQSAFAFIDHDAHRFPGERLEFIQVTGKENGSKIRDVPFPCSVLDNHAVGGKSGKDVFTVRRQRLLQQFKEGRVVQQRQHIR